MFVILIDSGDYEFSAIGPFGERGDAETFINNNVPDVHGPVVVEVEPTHEWES